MKLKAGFKLSELGLIPEDWEQTTVKNIASRAKNAIVGGPFGSELVSKDYVRRGTPVIRGQNMGGHYVGGEFVYVSDEKADSLKSNLAAPDDIVFTQRGTLGQVAVVPHDQFQSYLISQSQMKLSLERNAADPNFYYYLFAGEWHQNYIQRNAIQTGVPHLNLGILREIPVQCPPLPEQKAIAAALSDIDDLLASLDALITKKRDLKQAAMQQLLTGQTRLPGFHGEWEVKRLGALLTICHGKSQRDVEVSDGPYPILATGGQIGTASRPLYDLPSVLIGRKGTINRPRYIEVPFWTVDTLFYSIIMEGNNAKFLYYKFLEIDWLKFNEASGVPSLNARTIENIEILCPKPPEQTAIASVLSDMDAELAALEARRDKTRALKQAMMQELLTGKIRLV